MDLPDYEKAAAGLSLNRVDIEDWKAPEEIATEVHRQMDGDDRATPIYAVARALDIQEIRTVSLIGFEAALVTLPDRDAGSIVVSNKVGRARQRFSIAHELGHFLMCRHQPADVSSFQCKAKDIAGQSDGDYRHRRQEREANAFAIELLAPAAKVRRHLADGPNLEAVLAIAGAFDISREAAARRYVELSPTPTAVVFSKNGSFLYHTANAAFPALKLRRNQQMPPLPKPGILSRMSRMTEAEPCDWLVDHEQQELDVQTLWQQDDLSLIHI